MTGPVPLLLESHFLAENFKAGFMTPHNGNAGPIKTNGPAYPGEGGGWRRLPHLHVDISSYSTGHYTTHMYIVQSSLKARDNVGFFEGLI
jgi:hypothetical protein